jgi:hypothetical protein
MISQREARRLKKRVDQLEGVLRSQRASWGHVYPGGVNIATVTFAPEHTILTAIRTARKLDHAVVVVESGDVVYFYALPHYKVGL